MYRTIYRQALSPATVVPSAVRPARGSGLSFFLIFFCYPRALSIRALFPIFSRWKVTIPVWGFWDAVSSRFEFIFCDNPTTIFPPLALPHPLTPARASPRAPDYTRPPPPLVPVRRVELPPSLVFFFFSRRSRTHELPLRQASALTSAPPADPPHSWLRYVFEPGVRMCRPADRPIFPKPSTPLLFFDENAVFSTTSFLPFVFVELSSLILPAFFLTTGVAGSPLGVSLFPLRGPLPKLDGEHSVLLQLFFFSF